MKNTEYINRLALASRIIDVDYWGARDAEATEYTIANDIENDPEKVIEYLLNIIEDLQA